MPRPLPLGLAALAVFIGIAVYALGLMLFAVLPGEQGASWLKVAGKGALFGFFAYATYDLTNLATLKGWSARMAVVDTAWGMVVSAAAAAAVWWMAQRSN